MYVLRTFVSAHLLLILGTKYWGLAPPFQGRRLASFLVVLLFRSLSTPSYTTHQFLLFAAIEGL